MLTVTAMLAVGCKKPNEPNNGNNENPPSGAINGKFTINADGDQVYFSQGNLQYQARTQKWQFASKQYEIIGDDNNNISSDYNGWIDLFGWGTSGWESGANCYEPWSTSSHGEDYWPGGDSSNDLTGSCVNADWGIYNAITNGGNIAGVWRTLTGVFNGEWYYVFKTRNTPSGIRYAKAQVAGVNGMILLPDDWDTNTCVINDPNDAEASYSSNVFNEKQWTTMEDAGVVFLPAAGMRMGASAYKTGVDGNYWTASYTGINSSFNLYFTDSSLGVCGSGNRGFGFAVRLVCPVN